MGKGNAMPDVAIVKEPIWHIVQTPASIPREKGELSWWLRFWTWLGVIMAQPDNPRGWGWNPSVITLCLVILGIVASGAWYIGHLAAEIEFLKQSQQETRSTADDAHSKSLYAISKVDGGDGHAESNANANVKKKEKK